MDQDFDRVVREFDMFDQEQGANRWELFDHARRKCPVAHTESGKVLITRYEDVRYVLENPLLFSSTGVAPEPSPMSLNPLDSDPPYQPDLRKILNPMFSRTACLKFVPQMEEIANELIDRFVDAGEVELIMDFAAPFVAGVLARMVYNDSDPERVGPAIDAVTRVAKTGAPETYIEMAMVGGEYLVDRQENGSATEDVLWAVTQGTVLGGRNLTDDEQLGVLTVLFLGGLDTTRGAIGMIAHEIAKDPALEDRVRDPKWQRRDMDEFVRLASPVACLCRTVMEDTELNGVPLAKGTHLLVRFDSANHDPEQFEDPENLRFDLPRPGNAAFGLGIHRCLGVHLARVQIAVAFDVLLKRLTNLRLKPGTEDVQYIFGIARGPEKLELTFDRVADTPTG
jgi:cytochrome P450